MSAGTEGAQPASPTDELAVDFADPERNLFGLAQIGRDGEGALGVVFEGEEAVAVATDGEVAIEDTEGAGGASFRWEGDRFELEMSPASEPALLVSRAGFPEGLEREVVACRVSGEAKVGGSITKIDGLGQRTRLRGRPDWRGLATLRTLTPAFENGALLAVSAARPSRADGHGDEAVRGVLVDPERGNSPVRRVLLSTQYDDAERHLRAGLELDLDPEADTRPLRAAGTRLCGTTVMLGDVELEAAFFRWSMEGEAGLGRYDIARPRR